MEKVLVSIRKSYAKGYGEELDERYVIEDTKENRMELAENHVGDNASKVEIERFANGEINTLYFFSYGGDWDEPTGGSVHLGTKEAMLAIANNNYMSEIAEIELLFEDFDDKEALA